MTVSWPFADRPGPLAGLRVLDVGTMIAGPLAATLLADAGADVIKVEKPAIGDPMREWAPHKNGVSLWWKVTSRNKRLITLDLGKKEGAEILLQLAGEANVLVENFRPGTLARWGLDDATLLRANPKLVIVHISGYGQTGPYRDRPGYGTVAEALSGIPHFTGFPDNPPTLSAFPLADSVAAVFGAMAAAFATFRVLQGGPGQAVDVSLYEPLFRLVESQVIGYDQLGIVKQRRGNRLEEDSPRNVYRTLDEGWVAISASSPRTFERLARALEMPHLVEDERFRTNQLRIANADALDDLIAGWFASRSEADALSVLESAGVVAGPIYDIGRIFSDAHYLSRENIVQVADEDFGHVAMPNVTPKFSATPGRVRHAGKGLGADNEETYQSLGIGPERLNHLRAQGVV